MPETFAICSLVSDSNLVLVQFSLSYVWLGFLATTKIALREPPEQEEPNGSRHHPAGYCGPVTSSACSIPGDHEQGIRGGRKTGKLLSRLIRWSR